MLETVSDVVDILTDDIETKKVDDVLGPGDCDCPESVMKWSEQYYGNVGDRQKTEGTGTGDTP